MRFLAEVARSNGVRVGSGPAAAGAAMGEGDTATAGQLLDRLVGALVEPELVQPTFLVCVCRERGGGGCIERRHPLEIPQNRGTGTVPHYTVDIAVQTASSKSSRKWVPGYSSFLLPTSLPLNLFPFLSLSYLSLLPPPSLPKVSLGKPQTHTRPFLSASYATSTLNSPYL